MSSAAPRGAPHRDPSNPQGRVNWGGCGERKGHLEDGKAETKARRQGGVGGGAEAAAGPSPPRPSGDCQLREAPGRMSASVPLSPQVVALLAEEVGGPGPCGPGAGTAVAVGRARARKGDTPRGPEGLGSLWQVRPQPPQPSQGRAKVSRAGAGAGPGPPQCGPARGPAPRAPQKCPFVG